MNSSNYDINTNKKIDEYIDHLSTNNYKQESFVLLLVAELSNQITPSRSELTKLNYKIF